MGEKPYKSRVGGRRGEAKGREVNVVCMGCRYGQDGASRLTGRMGRFRDFSSQRLLSMVEDRGGRNPSAIYWMDVSSGRLPNAGVVLGT